MRTLLICILLVYAHASFGQRYDDFTATLKKLYVASPAEITRTWEDLVQSQRIPLVVEDSVAFLYRGAATSVMWMGDFNGWGYDKNFNNKGTRIPGTDIWILKKSFPADARLDYRIILNDTDIIVDPVNPYQQWSGVGGGSINSELRMGRWKEDPISQPLEAIFHGRVLKDQLIKSEHLGYQCMYSIYLPPDFRPSGKVYPILYVTDGYEYMHEKMGNMITILDNLIHLNKIRPVIVVFMDHREPVNRSNNRRMQELAMNDRYLTFLTDELIPRVEKSYPVSTRPEERGIIGTSMGGLAASYFSFSKPDIFGLAGVQSPAFWFKPEIYTFCDNPENPPVKIYLSTGSIHDNQEGAEKMQKILNKNTCNFEYKVVNQGHSWGNWKDSIDDMLIYFFHAE